MKFTFFLSAINKNYGNTNLKYITVELHVYGAINYQSYVYYFYS